MFEKALRNVQCAIWDADFAIVQLTMSGYKPNADEIAELREAEVALFARV